MGTLDPRALVHAALTLLFAGPIAFAQEVSVVEFQRDIRPILSDRCFACHGPDPAGRNSDLRLDSADAAFKDLGGYKAIVPGNLEDSELIYRITASNLADRMPPSDSGLSLEEREIELLKSWVRQGADFSPHWAYGKPPDSSPPAAENSAWPRDPIDSFILNKLREVERSPAEEAEPLAWLRRVHFAITGLPPTEEGARKFMESHSEEEYEKVVDSLLSSPHFGERMAQSWLDLARYADTFGYQSDVGTRVWPYRDWVIQAFNQNLPYDEFVRWQLAGDLLPNATAEQKTATAFNRLHRQTNEGGSVEEEYRIEYVSDRVHTFGTTFMGLTLECARCHDHRYDPISQKEYYQLSAYFDDIDESGLYSHFTSATPTPALDLPSPEQAQALAAAVAKVENEKIAAANGQLLDTTHQNASHRFTFDDRQDVQTVESPRGRAASLDGDTGIRMTGAGAWNRSDPFSVSMLLKTDRHHDRAVLLHRSRAWTDAGSQGWQILIEDGRLLFALIHFWPGNAAAIKTEEPLPLNDWVWVTVTSDGSSRAKGLAVHFDTAPQSSEIVRDSLTRSITGGGPGDPTLGERFRDRGFAGGLVDEVLFFDHADNSPSLVKIRDLRKERDSIQDAIPQLMVMKDMPNPRQAYLLDRGSYLDPKEPVSPGTPAFLNQNNVSQNENRSHLADWLLNQENPLTARVEVDRLWRAMFGKGLVRTPENFGSQGRPPTHPQMLDYLAHEFVRSGWDRKSLLRRIALSATFRQSSATNPEAWAADPENTLWGRGPSSPLSSEMLRDSALFASGLLVKKIGGPSVLPYQPAGLWSDKGAATYSQSKGENLYRRSLYTYWKRTSPPPSMTILDAAERDVCVARREPTNTPLQALVLWNDPQFGEAARVLAATLCGIENPLETAFLRLTGKFPSPNEITALENLFDSEKAAFLADPARAQALVAVGEAPAPKDIPVAEHAAWTLVCSAIMASDQSISLR